MQSNNNTSWQERKSGFGKSPFSFKKKIYCSVRANWKKKKSKRQLFLSLEGISTSGILRVFYWNLASQSKSR